MCQSYGFAVPSICYSHGISDESKSVTRDSLQRHPYNKSDFQNTKFDVGALSDIIKEDTGREQSTHIM